MKTRLFLVSLAAGAIFGCPQQSYAQSEPYRQAQVAPNQMQTPRPPRLDPEYELRPGKIEPVQEPERPAGPSAQKAAHSGSVPHTDNHRRLPGRASVHELMWATPVAAAAACDAGDR
jgi:hypothetical protein